MPQLVRDGLAEQPPVVVAISPGHIKNAVRQNVRTSSLACDEPEYRLAQPLLSAHLQLLDTVPREQEHAQRESACVRGRLRAKRPEDPDTNGLVNTRGFPRRRRHPVWLNRGEVAHVRHNGRLAATRGFLLLDRRLTGLNNASPPHPHKCQNTDPLETPRTAHGTSPAAGVISWLSNRC